MAAAWALIAAGESSPPAGVDPTSGVGAGSGVAAFGAATFLFGFIMTLFEGFVAYLQAFIFATLSTVYINLSYPED